MYNYGPIIQSPSGPQYHEPSPPSEPDYGLFRREGSNSGR